MISSGTHNASVGASSTSSISPEHLRVLLREAAAGAHRLVRKLRLPNHEHEDLRQDLLVDLIGRFHRFNPDRGSLGAFAGVIVRHRAKCLAHRVYRERTIFAPISPEDVSPDADGAVSHQRVRAIVGCIATGGQTHDTVAEIDRRIDLSRSLGTLRPGELSLCNKLLERTPTEISRTGEVSRANIYRRLRDIRLRLQEGGVSSP